MKKIILQIVLLFLFSITAYAQTTVLYRISSGEVYGISTTNKNWQEAEQDEFAQVSDPVMADGYEWYSPDYKNRFRVLGYTKIYDNGTVRNATQQEINGFLSAAVDNQNQKIADQTKAYIEQDEKFRKIMVAISAILASEFNRHRDFEEAVKAAAADAVSLADFKIRMAAIESVPERQNNDLLTAIKNRISKDD